MTKAEFIKMFRYLDELAASGVTNMYGAPSYLIKDYGLTEKQATMFWLAWIKTFSPNISIETRANIAYNTQELTMNKEIIKAEIQRRLELHPGDPPWSCIDCYYGKPCIDKEILKAAQQYLNGRAG